MPYLGDYLGHLLSEITLARVQADLEALRVAELYASDPLLRHFPVPHFRLPTLTLDVPVAVRAMEEAKKGESPRGRVKLQALNEAFQRLLATKLKGEGIRLNAEGQRRVRTALDKTLASRKILRPAYVAVSVKDIAGELAAATVAAIQGARKLSKEEEARLKRLGEDLRREAFSEFLGLRETPPRLVVMVTNSELREAGPADFLARLHLTISEEAVEWTVIESEGKSIDRLVPE